MKEERKGKTFSHTHADQRKTVPTLNFHISFVFKYRRPKFDVKWIMKTSGRCRWCGAHRKLSKVAISKKKSCLQIKMSYKTIDCHLLTTLVVNAT